MMLMSFVIGTAGGVLVAIGLLFSYLSFTEAKDAKRLKNKQLKMAARMAESMATGDGIRAVIAILVGITLIVIGIYHT